MARWTSLVIVTINDRQLIYQEIRRWTVGLVGDPPHQLVDAGLTQQLDLFGPLTAEELVVRMALSPIPTWCSVERALERLLVLEQGAVGRP